MGALCAYALSIGIIWIIILKHGPAIARLLSKVPLREAIGLMILQIPMLAFGGYAFQILAKNKGMPLAWQEWAGLSFIANLLNQFLPYRPGMVFRYFYLRHNYQIKPKNFMQLSFFYFGIVLTLSAAFTLGGAFQSGFLPPFHPLMMVSCLLLLIAGGSFFLLDNKVTLLFSSCPLFAMMSLTAFILWGCFWATGKPVPFVHCIFLAGVINVALIFPITPGNIGILEGLIGLVTQHFYQDFSLGFSVCALYRATQSIASLLMGLSFGLILFTPVFFAPGKKLDFGPSPSKRVV